jgi:hypothetical protein
MPPDLPAYALPGGDLHLSAQALLELMEGVLSRGLPFRFCARGSSMLPFIQDGDVICVAPLNGRRPGLGQVVAYRQGGARLVVHRVIWRASAGWRIQGDNLSSAAAEWVSSAEILGWVTGIERRGRAICLGLGLERYPIALLARAGLLAPLTRLAAGLYHRLLALHPV